MSAKARYLCLASLAAVAGAVGVVWAQGRADGERLYAQAQAALEAGDLQQAEDLAKQLEKQGDVAHRQVLQAALWRAEGKRLLDRVATTAMPPAEQQELQERAKRAFRLAINELSDCRAEDPLALDAAVIGAECMIFTGEFRLPAEALRAAVRRQPDRLDAHRLLASIYVDVGAREDAIRHYREWARLDPEDGRPHRWIGYFYKGQNRAGEAAQAYAEAHRRKLADSVRALVLREWAETLIEGQGAFQEALDVLARLSEPWANTPEIRALQAECLWTLGRPEAIERIDAVLKERPNMLRALVLRARIHLAQERPKEALPLLEKALGIDAHDLGARQHLMQAYQALGDSVKTDEERKRLEESRETKNQLTRLHGEATLRPWDERVRLQIAELCLKIERPNEARLWLRACLAINRANAEAQKQLERLNAPLPNPIDRR